MIPFPDGLHEKHGMDVVKAYRPDETSVINIVNTNGHLILSF